MIKCHRFSHFQQSTLDQFQTCVKCEEADISSEIACRADKIARIEADILRVEQAIEKTEAALKQVILWARLQASWH
jgi:hypothetical protein